MGLARLALALVGVVAFGAVPAAPFEDTIAQRVIACTGCHGTQMTGLAPFIPGLLGLPRDYLNAQLGAWRSGQRRALPPDCMAQVAQRLSPEDIGAVSAWLAAQPVPAHAAAPPAPSMPLPIACGGVAMATGAASAPTR